MNGDIRRVQLNVTSRHMSGPCVMPLYLPSARHCRTYALATLWHRSKYKDAIGETANRS